jgi:2-succinyl-5-enolpyruvyl-6-hydroxy-3-cyclohexene-1-carboxylate synthase
MIGTARAAAPANAAAAGALVDELARAGVRDVCVSPGARSTPLALAVASHPALRPWVVTDERSAGFFAVGLARASRRAVAVVCTSGTAVANLGPAVAEASFAEVPLLLVTADRPTELRDCGAPQTIRQPGLFAPHARWSVDTAVPDDGAALAPYFRTLACRAVGTAVAAPMGPVHLNVPFREPLLDPTAGHVAPHAAGRPGGRPWTTVVPATLGVGHDTVAELTRIVRSSPRGLVVCGPATGTQPSYVAAADLGRRLGWPVLADPLSGVRHGAHDRGVVIDAYDVLLRSPAFRDRHRADVIVRFGAVPTSKALQQYLSMAGPTHHVLVAAPGTWPDPLATVSAVVHADAAEVCDRMSEEVRDEPSARDAGWLAAWQDADDTLRSAVDAQLAAQPALCELPVAADLVALLPNDAVLVVGNSLPVRHIDTFVGGTDKTLRILANRGANGIDGVLSTALGAAAGSGRPTALLVGDLSFLHDLGGLQIAARHGIDLLVVVLNNDGGAIFSFLPQARLGETFERYFVTPHGLDLEPAVRMCGGTFARPATRDAFRGAVDDALRRPGLRVIEVRTDREQTRARHAAIVEHALARLHDTQGGGGT